MRVCGPATQRVDDERIVHIDQDGNSGIDCGDGFDRQDGVKEAATGSAEGFGGLNPEESQLEELLEEVGIKLLVRIHAAHQRLNLFQSERAHGGVEKALFFRELRERGRSGGVL